VQFFQSLACLGIQAAGPFGQGIVACAGESVTQGELNANDASGNFLEKGLRFPIQAIEQWPGGGRIAGPHRDICGRDGPKSQSNGQ
jgi:hypothetical protein